LNKHISSKMVYICNRNSEDPNEEFIKENFNKNSFFIKIGED
jgi:hypothetical protein